MSKYQAQTGPPFGLTTSILPPAHNESKRDRKRRETINRVQEKHEDSWRTRDERFSTLYKEYHNDNKSVNTQPPTSQRYLFRLYPSTIERDALLEEAEIEHQYKCAQAKKMYEMEREAIEAQHWEARDQSKQFFIAHLEDRRRRLREEKEGGDNITDMLLEQPAKARPVRRLPFRHPPKGSEANGSRSANGSGTPTAPGGLASSSSSSGSDAHAGASKKDDLLLHRLLGSALSTISVDDILPPNSSSLAVLPPAVHLAYNTAPPKRGPRGKGDQGNNADKDAIPAAPGTLTALAAAAGQTGNRQTSRNAGANQGMVFGRSIAEFNKLMTASQLEIESDWARINGSSGRGRRGRADP